MMHLRDKKIMEVFEKYVEKLRKDVKIRKILERRQSLEWR
jgi:hypothetical protein